MSDMELHLHFDGNKTIVEQVQDVEGILEQNKAMRAERQTSEWGRHVASIPNVIMVRWLNEEYMRGNINLRMFTTEFDELVARKLKDPEWAYLRTDSAQVQSFLGFGS